MWFENSRSAEQILNVKDKARNATDIAQSYSSWALESFQVSIYSLRIPFGS